MKKIDIIIPTMWKEPKIIDYIKSYVNCPYINKVILVDNDYRARIKSDILNSTKVELVDYKRNIYVNPAWNEGFYRSTQEILCILNDDIFVDISLFEFISNLNFSDIDLIGVHLQGSIDNFHIIEHFDKKEQLFKLNINRHEPIGGQSYAFGVCMFIKKKSYRVIPSLYQIWYGDDFLIQHCKNIYTLRTSKITGEISKTIVAFDEKSDVQKRIVLDSKNAYRFNHFLNSKNWDLVKQYNRQDL